MDPNIALANLRQLVAFMINGDGTAQEGTELARQFEALDEWINKGGFLPDRWADGQDLAPSVADRLPKSVSAQFWRDVDWILSHGVGSIWDVKNAFRPNRLAELIKYGVLKRSTDEPGMYVACDVPVPSRRFFK